MARVKVALQDSIKRVVFVETDATIGATLGTNLFLPNGNVGTPATVRDWLGITGDGTATPAGGTNHHRLLQGLTLGDDHPQYTQWVQNEVITGAWTFQNTLTVDIASGEQWFVDADEVFQTVPLTIENNDGLLISPPEAPGAGFDFTTIPGADPLGQGIGGQLFFRENAAGTFGMRIRWTGDALNDGSLDFYRHSNDLTGVLTFSVLRDSTQLAFAAGSNSVPVIAAIGDLNTGFYFPASDQAAIATGGVQRLLVTSTFVQVNNVQLRVDDGSAAAPSIVFDDDAGLNTGFYFPAQNTIGVTTAGTLRLLLSSTLITASLPLRADSFEVGNDNDTSITRVSAGVIAVEGQTLGRITAAESVSAIWTHTVAPRFSNTLSPAQITSNQDNYSPAGLTNAAHLRLSTDASRDITGLATGSGGRWLIVSNVGGFPIVLRHENTGSSEANRFLFDDGLDLTLGTEESRMFWYDATATRWRTLRDTGAGGSGVTSIQEGEAITVDASDPSEPIVGIDIMSLTEDATPSGTNDFVVTWDASAGAHRRVALDNLPGGAGAFSPDTSTVPPRAGDMLYYNGSEWFTSSPRVWTYLFQDFVGFDPINMTSGQGLWDINVLGTAAAITGTPVAGSPGVIRITSGTGSGAQSGIINKIVATSAAVCGYVLGGGEIIFRCRMRWVGADLPDNTTAGNAFLRIGLLDEISGAPTKGIYITTDGQTSSGAFAGEWLAATSNAGGGLTYDQDSAIAITTDTWHILEIRVSSDGATVTFYVDDTLFATATATLPAGVALVPAVQIQRAAASGDSFVIDVDYIECMQIFSTARN